jgi:hypothetical protein
VPTLKEIEQQIDTASNLVRMGSLLPALNVLYQARADLEEIYMVQLRASATAREMNLSEEN